jgi:hypothetical protein
MGPATICPGITGIPYSVTPQPGIITYQWSYSGTGVVIHNNGSSEVSIDFSSSATAGQLSVQVVNPCGGANATGNLNIQIGSIQNCLYINCLLSNLFVTDNTLMLPGMPQIFKIGGSITSDATIQQPKTVLFKAGTNVNLQPGFNVNSGAVFIAEIEGCPIVFPFALKN